MTIDRKETNGLEAMFVIAREDAAADVPMDLVDRVLADADAAIPGVAFAGCNASVPPRRRFLDLLLSTIGGWPSAAGLAATAVAGVWIGVSPPEALDSLAADLWEVTTGDVGGLAVLDGLDLLLAEG